MDQMTQRLYRWELNVGGWLGRVSLPFLQISLGLIFIGFGILKFVPGLSPAESLVEQTMTTLTFGLVPAWLGTILVAGLETAIGLCLLIPGFARLGVVLLGVAMIGILSPLLLFPGELFAGPLNAPTLVGQYVLKDIVLLAAAMVIAARTLGGRPGSPPSPARWRERHPEAVLR
jgi:putative oxidoreductase